MILMLYHNLASNISKRLSVLKFVCLSFYLQRTTNASFSILGMNRSNRPMIKLSPNITLVKYKLNFQTKRDALLILINRHFREAMINHCKSAFYSWKFITIQDIYLQGGDLVPSLWIKAIRHSSGYPPKVSLVNNFDLNSR